MLCSQQNYYYSILQGQFWPHLMESFPLIELICIVIHCYIITIIPRWSNTLSSKSSSICEEIIHVVTNSQKIWLDMIKEIDTVFSLSNIRVTIPSFAWTRLSLLKVWLLAFLFVKTLIQAVWLLYFQKWFWLDTRDRWRCVTEYDTFTKGFNWAYHRL